MNDKKTTILLIRHGQTDWNVQKRWQGKADIPLNETGLKQSHLLAERMAVQFPMSRLYTSSLSRAQTTATIVAEKMGIPLHPSDIWQERDAGYYTGKSYTEISNLNKEISETNLIIDDGETPEQVLARIQPEFERLIAKHAGEQFGIVTHGATMGTLIAHILNIPLADNRLISVGTNTGISRITILLGERPRLTLLNDGGHLE